MRRRRALSLAIAEEACTRPPSAWPSHLEGRVSRSQGHSCLLVAAKVVRGELCADVKGNSWLVISTESLTMDVSVTYNTEHSDPPVFGAPRKQHPRPDSAAPLVVVQNMGSRERHEGRSARCEQERNSARHGNNSEGGEDMSPSDQIQSIFAPQRMRSPQQSILKKSNSIELMCVRLERNPNFVHTVTDKENEKDRQEGKGEQHSNNKRQQHRLNVNEYADAIVGEGDDVAATTATVFGRPRFSG
jgi:hypothetical protein